MRALVGGIAVALVVAPVAACSLLVSTDDLSDGARDAAVDAGALVDGDARAAPDAPSADAAPPADAAPSDASPDAGASDGAVVAPIAYRKVVLADQPALYWRFGESSGTTVADDSSNGRFGTYQSGAILGAPGAIANDPNTALRLNGGGPGASGASNLDFSARQPFSFEVWIKPSAADATRRLILTRPYVDANGYQQIGMYLAQTEGLIFERNVNNVQITAAAPVPPFTAFTYVVAAYDGATLMLYVDGALVTSTPDARSQVAKPTSSWNVGMDPPASGLFEGVLDELAIYPVALTAAQVARHHAAGLGQLTN